MQNTKYVYFTMVFAGMRWDWMIFIISAIYTRCHHGECHLEYNTTTFTLLLTIQVHWKKYNWNCAKGNMKQFMSMTVCVVASEAVEFQWNDLVSFTQFSSSVFWKVSTDSSTKLLCSSLQRTIKQSHHNKIL